MLATVCAKGFDVAERCSSVQKMDAAGASVAISTCGAHGCRMILLSPAHVALRGFAQALPRFAVFNEEITKQRLSLRMVQHQVHG